MIQIFIRNIFVVQHYPQNIFNIKLFLNYSSSNLQMPYTKHFVAY